MVIVISHFPGANYVGWSLALGRREACAGRGDRTSRKRRGTSIGFAWLES